MRANIHKQVADMIGMNPARFSQKINKNKKQLYY